MDRAWHNPAFLHLLISHHFFLEVEQSPFLGLWGVKGGGTSLLSAKCSSCGLHEAAGGPVCFGASVVREAALQLCGLRLAVCLCVFQVAVRIEAT